MHFLFCGLITRWQSRIHCLRHFDVKIEALPRAHSRVAVAELSKNANSVDGADFHVVGHLFVGRQSNCEDNTTHIDFKSGRNEFFLFTGGIINVRDSHRR